MDQGIVQKIDQVIVSTKHIGLVLPERLGVDGLCAGLAIAKKFFAQGKIVTLFSSAKNLPNLNFYSFKPQVYQEISVGKEFVIKLNGAQTKPKQLRYEKQGNDLLIYITPEAGQFKEQDVQVLPQAGDLDLLLMVGVSALEKIGPLYSSHTELFYNTPKIVINNQLDQEYFGSLNWIESTASCISEQVASWLLADEKINQDDVVVTGLLAGIIDSTQSFRDPKTTPRTLAVAADLVKRGARRQDVIQHLFKTKSFTLLQLWGRSLARIRTAPEQELLYTLLTEQDFIKTESTAELLPQVLQELAIMASNYQLIALAAKTPHNTEIYLVGRPHIKLRQLAAQIDSTQAPLLEPLNSHYYMVRLVLPDLALDQAEVLISNLRPTGI